jgi:hypothetical protein
MRFVSGTTNKRRGIGDRPLTLNFLQEADSRMLKENMKATLIDFPPEKTCLIELSKLLSFLREKMYLNHLSQSHGATTSSSASTHVPLQNTSSE